MTGVRKVRKMAKPPQDPKPEDLGTDLPVVDEAAEYQRTTEAEFMAAGTDGDELPEWARSTVPSAVAPDVTAELSILVGNSGLTTLDTKPDTIIVPTIHPGLNRALHVAGVPASCMCVLHGPSRGGKTALLLALIRSFQVNGHLAAMVDAEFSLEKLFASQLGVDIKQLIYRTPETFEETTAVVEGLIKNFKKGRAAGTIDPNRCLFIGVDSINKLVPKDEMEKLRVEGKQFPLRALLTTMWFDKLTPTIGNLPILFAVIAHEKVKMNAGGFGPKYQVKGGATLIYDSTMAFRVTMVKTLKATKGKKTFPIGKVHKVVIEKSKVGISHEVFNFVMSNGKGIVPIGFDFSREVLEEIKLRGDRSTSLYKSGGHWKCEMFPKGQLKGDKAASEFLFNHPDALDQIMAELNATSTDVEIIVSDGDVEGDEGDDE